MCWVWDGDGVYEGAVVSSLKLLMRKPSCRLEFKLEQTGFRISFSCFGFVYFDYCVYFDYGILCHRKSTAQDEDENVFSRTKNYCLRGWKPVFEEENFFSRKKSSERR